ncbi:hypothetical protein KI387_018433, partial [Taxus chinensis]
NIPTSDPLVDVFQRLTLGEYRLYNVSSFHTPQEYGQLHAHPTYDRRVGEVISYGPPNCRTNLTYGGVDASSVTPEPPL